MDQVKSVQEFLKAVIELSKKHGLSIAHEDTQGAFRVMKYDEDFSKWLMAADDETGRDE